MSLYYECHITIAPVFGARLEEFNWVCADENFRVAELVMKRSADDTGAPNREDAFCTGRDKVWKDLQRRMIRLIGDLQAREFKVLRYKIEDTLLDSKINDELILLGV